MMKFARRSAILLILLCASAIRAQQRTPQQIVQAAVQTELQADRDDHTAWIYRDHEVTPGQDTLYLVAESPEGTVKRKIEEHGHPLTPAQARQEDARVQAFVADAPRQQKERQNEKHDDNQATVMLQLLPKAFLCTF